jgi:L-lactate dehydrogenase complex protein LldE
VSADWGCLLNIKGSLAYQGRILPATHLASFLLAHSRPDSDEIAHNGAAVSDLAHTKEAQPHV